MAVTTQTAIDLARDTLNDAEKVRWPDAECLKYLKNAVDTLYDMRPDMFHLNDYATVFDSDLLELDTPSNLPIDNRYQRLIADYIIFRCETKDDQSVVTQRAVQSYQFFQHQTLS